LRRGDEKESLETALRHKCRQLINAQEVLGEAHNQLGKLHNMAGVAAAIAAEAAAPEQAATSAQSAYRDAATGLCEAAAEAAAEAAGAAAAAQRAAQAEAAGQRATERYALLGVDAPAPDTNAKTAAEWAKTAKWLTSAMFAAATQYVKSVELSRAEPVNAAAVLLRPGAEPEAQPDQANPPHKKKQRTA
jgi:hypothetical protein